MSWPTARLGDVASELTVGFVGTMADQYVDAGVRFLRSQDITPYRILTDDNKFISEEFHTRIRKSRLIPGDVVIVRTGKPGTCAVVPEGLGECNCSDLVIVRPGPRLNPKFLSYYINGVASHHVDAFTVGAVQQHFNVGGARELRFPFPPLPVQDRIAATLGSLDDKIELNRRLNQTLEEAARAIFRSWFVDFDPVLVKARGGDLTAELGLSPEIAALFPDSFQDSELGEIPEGWTPGTVKDLCDRVINGSTPSRARSDFWEGGTIPWFTTSELQNEWVLDSKQFITDAGIAGSSARELPAKSILMAIYAAPTVGRLGILALPATFNQACTGMVAKSTVGPWFLFESLANLNSWFNQRANGAAQQNISKGIVEEGPVVLTPQPVLQAFNVAVESLFEQRLALAQESKHLAETRDYLLPLLLAAKIDLRSGGEP